MADADECYYFDGSAGCDACDAMTGYYLDEPSGPHPNCNCPVESVSADIEYELRNVSWTEGNTHVEIEEPIDNCDNDEEAAVALSLGEDEDENFDEGLREAAEAAGWSEPDVEALDVTVPMPPHTQGDLEMTVERYVATFEAEVWAILPDGSEKYVGDATGYYEKNVNVDKADLTGWSCDSDFDRWIPRPDDGPGNDDGGGGDSEEPIV